ncbi:MAG: pseudouridine synthase [Rickettsiales bacterium]|nr:pseudouridine synthase [Rickettsiales bacterium]
MLQKKLSAEKGIRIAKYIAHSGFCSRRDAENLILEGRVKVNGQVIETPATLIFDQSVKIDDKLINAKTTIRLWLFHKPKSIITTHKDEKNRPTIFDLLPKNIPRVISVGRLDFNTEGLLLLTNNGDFARYLELPQTKILRQYRARVFGKINHERLKKLSKGITVNGVRYGSIKVDVDNEGDSNSWLTITISEGKNREIRKVMEHLGLQVNRLIRTSFGPFELGALKVGELQEVSRLSLKKHFGDNFKF